MKTDIAALLKQREFSANQEPPKEEIVFRIQFQTICGLGDYFLFTGRPKAGKTKYLAGAMAAAVSRQEVFGMNIRLPEGKQRVVHFDTEQGKRSHFNVLDLMKNLMDTKDMPVHFQSYHCRQDTPATIIAMVEYYLDINPDTGLVFLDGLLDCIDSFNDEKASKGLINWLKRITESKNCGVAGVLHRSMSVDKSIGHLGSSADRAAQSVLIVEKNKETKQYILKAEYLRDGDDFVPIAIHYNKQLSIWEQCDYIDDPQALAGKKTQRRPGDFDIGEHVAHVTRIFQLQTTYDYKPLLNRMIEVYGCGLKWAKECVPILERENLIWRVGDGFTNIRQGKLKMVQE